MLVPANYLLIAPLISLSAAQHAPLDLQNDNQAILDTNFIPESSAMSSSPLSTIGALNVFGKPLVQHSTTPITGWLRDGFCHVPEGDRGNHAIAAEVTDEFLAFSASRGNDLRGIDGMKSGCKWCLCASRWLEAFNARTTEKDGDKIVPKVFLNATNQKALGKIKIEDLKAFSADPTNGS